MTVEFDSKSTITQPSLGGTLLPVPSSMQEGTYHYGGSFQLPNGDIIKQVRFTGRTVSWTWEGMNYDDQSTVQGIIAGNAFDKVQLSIPVPSGESEDTICVKPDGDSAYSATIRYNPDAQSYRWTVAMKWKEVPGTCVPV